MTSTLHDVTVLYIALIDRQAIIFDGLHNRIAVYVWAFGLTPRPTKLNGGYHTY